jgi:hypothetical protein
MPSHARSLTLVLGSWLLTACGSHETASTVSSDGGVELAGGCKAGLLQESGKCVDPLRRYEPSTGGDVDNVVSYSGDPALALPPPPKSGFRLVVPPRTLAPGDELEDCQAWKYPDIGNKNVYAARVYTSGGLHHSNMYGVPLAAAGPSPYPKCAPGQADVASQVGNMLQGDIMDVLFANSTQIDGGEQIVFPPGMAFKLKTDGREATTTIHWLNVTSTDLVSEVVYDFFTMPDAEVTQEIVPFVFENQGFTIPPHSEGEITTTCDLVRPGNIVSIMPHTHKRATSFDVELIREDGSTESIFHDGAFDTQSDIKVFDTPISLEGFSKIHHRCGVTNDLTDPIVWGIGQNEMCTLFGYLYPPSAQLLGFVAPPATAGGPQPGCQTLDIGAHRQ